MDKRPELEEMLSHQIRLAERYRFFVSVVMVTANKKALSVKDIVSENVRQCDAVFSLPSGSAILMAHTSAQEARLAINRLRMLCGNEIDFRFSIASYPGDVPAADLLSRAERRLETATTEAGGTVICDVD